MNPAISSSQIVKASESLPKIHLNDDIDQEIFDRLSSLDEFAIRLFYWHRARRRITGILSSNALDLLTLEALEQSFAYRTGNVLS